jgi:uncharacterized delta-60 repeat protein
MNPHFQVGTLRASSATLAAIYAILALVQLFGPAESPARGAEIESLLDHTFVPPGVPGSISAVATQFDGKTLLASVQFDGVQHSYLARFDAQGNLDRTFDAGTGPGVDLTAAGSACINLTILALAPTTSGIFVGGSFNTFNGVRRPLVAKLRLDGSLDPTFNPDLPLGNPLMFGGCYSMRVTSIAIQPDGKVLLAGEFHLNEYYLNAGGTTATVIRLNPDGSRDRNFQLWAGFFSPSYDSSGNYYSLDSIALQADGKLLIGGSFRAVNGFVRDGLVRLNTDGTVDQSFRPNLKSDWSDLRISVIALLPDGDLLIGGGFQSVNGLRRHGIARIRADGSLDGSFYPGKASYGGIYGIALEPDGRVLACTLARRSPCIPGSSRFGIPSGSPACTRPQVPSRTSGVFGWKRHRANRFRGAGMKQRCIGSSASCRKVSIA